MNTDLARAPNLVAAFRNRVEDSPDADALVFINNPDQPGEGADHWSFARLDMEARTRAAWMQEHLEPNSRVLLLHPNSTEFAAAFYGCLYADMIAVPAPVPERHRHRHRVAKILADSTAGAVLTTGRLQDDLQGWAAESGLEVPVMAGDAPGLADPAAWRPVGADRSSLAFLQYTSGSTGDPKGVAVTHGNALWNGSAVRRGVGWESWMRMGGWLPLFHDMGLVQLLYSTILGGSCALMEPSAFIRRPVRWLRAIQAHQIHVGFAPSFGYDWCVQRITEQEMEGLDLSGWHVAGNGSEPIDPAVIHAFTKKFAPVGFRSDSFAPVYGLAESTVYVSGRRGREPTVRAVTVAGLAEGVLTPAVSGQPHRELVSCGPPTDACEILVVDAGSQVLPEGRLGEIWLRGPSISTGYWRRLDPEGQVFDAVTADGRTGFLRTGDLGALLEGELYVQGRIKDLLIVRGRNLYPADIEGELRRRHPELGRVGAVFTAPLDDAGTTDSDAVVIAHEVRGLPLDRLSDLASLVRRTVIQEFGVRVADVVLLPAGAVSRTTSGKVQRTDMRERFRRRELSVLDVRTRAQPALDSTP